MSSESVHQMIGRALTDPRFREDLLQRPGEVVEQYPFTRGERALIQSLRAGSLEEFARKLSEALEVSTNGDRRRNGRA